MSACLPACLPVCLSVFFVFGVWLFCLCVMEPCRDCFLAFEIFRGMMLAQTAFSRVGLSLFLTKASPPSSSFHKRHATFQLNLECQNRFRFLQLSWFTWLWEVGFVVVIFDSWRIRRDEEAFRQRYPVDEAAWAYLVKSNVEVQREARREWRFLEVVLAFGVGQTKKSATTKMEPCLTMKAWDG